MTKTLMLEIKLRDPLSDIVSNLGIGDDVFFQQDTYFTQMAEITITQVNWMVEVFWGIERAVLSPDFISIENVKLLLD